jgi:hypothetical protein
MTDLSSSSSSPKGSALSSGPPPAGSLVAAPDAASARGPKGHFNQAFKLAAVRYALECGKSQRAAAADMGVSDKTLSGWIGDAALDLGDLLAGFDERLLKTADFPRNFRFRQVAPRDGVPGAVQDKNLPAGNAGGNGDAAIHLFSLKLA